MTERTGLTIPVAYSRQPSRSCTPWSVDMKLSISSASVGGIAARAPIVFRPRTGGGCVSTTLTVRCAKAAGISGPVARIGHVELRGQQRVSAVVGGAENRRVGVRVDGRLDQLVQCRGNAGSVEALCGHEP